MEPADFFITTLIKLDLWNQAGWHGVQFAIDLKSKQPPIMGLLFRDGSVGREIFRGLRQAVGPKDEHERLRIAIIEGDISGMEAGYSVSFGPDGTRIIEDAKAEKQPIDTSYLVVVTRICRMNPRPDSPYLAGFKQEFARHGRFFVVPAFQSDGKPDMDLSLGIEKARIAFRQAKDIGPLDIDSGAIKRRS